MTTDGSDEIVREEVKVAPVGPHWRVSARSLSVAREHRHTGSVMGSHCPWRTAPRGVASTADRRPLESFQGAGFERLVAQLALQQGGGASSLLELCEEGRGHRDGDARVLGCLCKL